MLKRLPDWNWPAVLPLLALFGIAVYGTTLPISPPTQAEPSKSERRADSEITKVDPNERIADYTLGLEIFTGVVACSALLNIWVLWRTDRTARRTARIALRQAQIAARQTRITSAQSDLMRVQNGIARQEFFATHRPKLEIRFAQRLRANPHLQGGDKHIYVEFSVINTGTSTALITGSRVRLDWFYPDDVPNPDVMGGHDDVIPVRRLIVSARARCSIVAEIGGPSSMAEGFSDEAVEGTDPEMLVLFGWVVYEDERGAEFGDTRTTYFCRAFDPKTARFNVIPQLADWEFTH